MKKIKLTNGGYAVVDDRDFSFLNKFKWKKDIGGYAVRQSRLGGRKAKFLMFRMHRIVLMLPDSGRWVQIDHKDHNRLNNQSSNLRICSQALNNRNATMRTDNKWGYKGVAKHNYKWIARIQANGEKIVLEGFNSPKEAAHAYNKLARKYHGKFAYLNKIK